MSRRLPQVGEVLDETYELVEHLDQGGFGSIYRARQRHVDRDVALKLMVCPPDRGEVMAERFRREVSALRVLRHPNTIQILDFRELDAQTLYYVMEFLRGENLHQVLQREGPQPARRVKHIIRQVLKSLAEAHEHGIIHRDLKPANVMLVALGDQEDFVKVLDFGIAKKIGASREDALTAQGKIVGTLSYMSPEQLLGRELSAATDLYAVGLLMLELLMGRGLFEGMPQREVVELITSREPIPLPRAAQLHPLHDWIVRSLQKHPALRFTSAAEALDALDAFDSAALDDYEAQVSRSGTFATLKSNSPLTQLSKPITELLDVQEREGDEPALLSLPTQPGVGIPPALRNKAPTVPSAAVTQLAASDTPRAASAPDAQPDTPEAHEAHRSLTGNVSPARFALVLGGALIVPLLLIAAAVIALVLVVES